MQAFSKDNSGIKYLLTVIDIISKFVWNMPSKRKNWTGSRKSIFDDLKGTRRSKIWVDKGRELYNKDVQKLIELYSTENEEKSCVIERFNRTINDKMFKYFSANNTRKFVDVIDILVYQYNNAIHSLIKWLRKKQVVRKTKLKCGEVYIQNLLVRRHQNLRLLIINVRIR